MKFQKFPTHLLTIGLLVANLHLGQAEQIAVVYCLEQDAQSLTNPTEADKTPLPLHRKGIKKVHIPPHDLYLIQAGSGTESTAANTARILDAVNPDRIYHIGPAGNLTDIPIGTTVEITGFDAYQTGIVQNGRTLKDLITAWEGSTDFPKERTASGNLFIADSQKRTELAQQSQCNLVEMNVYGFMTAIKTSTTPNLPRTILKIVSDNADEKASEDFAEFSKDYPGTLGTYIKKIVAKLPPNPAQAESYETLKNAIQEGKTFEK